MYIVQIIILLALQVPLSLFGQYSLTQKSENGIPLKFYEQTYLFPEYCVIKGNDGTKRIALTFDDGPSLTSKKVLEILKKYDAKATFFWLGSNLSDHQDILRKAINEGHTVANHSWNHPNLGEYSIPEFWKEQVNKTNRKFRKLMHHKVKYFRPPFGNISNEQIDFLKKKNIKTILWTFSSLDWDSSQNSCGQISQRVISNLEPGAIILFHDFDADDNEDAGPDRNGMLMAIEKILIKGKQLGYEFVSIEELLTNE